MSQDRSRVYGAHQTHLINSPPYCSDGRRLPTNRRQHVFPNGTLVLTTSVKNEDEGLYRCTARNKDGTGDSGTLRVKVQGEHVLYARRGRYCQEFEKKQTPKSSVRIRERKKRRKRSESVLIKHVKWVWLIRFSAATDERREIRKSGREGEIRRPEGAGGGLAFAAAAGAGAAFSVRDGATATR